jgi:hypothetical protein
MLTRTRNELLIAAGFGLLILAVGVFYFRSRVERTELGDGDSLPPVTVHSDVVAGDRCPVLTSWVASPLQTSVGSWIDVGAAAQDDDGERLGFAWQPAARFQDSHAATTRYRCDEAGMQTLTLHVSDDHRPLRCATHLTMRVVCVAR